MSSAPVYSTPQESGPIVFSGFLAIKNYRTQPKPIGPTKKAIRILKQEIAARAAVSSNVSSGLSSTDKPVLKVFRVLDLGSGGAKCTFKVATELKDLYQLEITAVERDADGKKYIDLVSQEPDIAGKVTFNFKHMDIEDFLIENGDQRYDLVIASYSLFYIKDFDSLMPKVLDLVRPGGLFAGHFLGDQDDWCTGKAECPPGDLTFLSRLDVSMLFHTNGYAFVGYRDKAERDFESTENVKVRGVILERGRGTKLNRDGFKERIKTGYRFKARSVMQSFHVVARKQSPVNTEVVPS